ncbi:hypothetical protein FLSA109164_00440 [Flavobacterium saliperosum]|uniref:Uncharacterized protein n=1 Tax=Flavobacterium saliperosum TaxID=329186 RepID=A0A1G4VXG6_9FLAO|nr:hypothetical protein SAMN02927925_01937 [Flavobacterium saliperosum]
MSSFLVVLVYSIVLKLPIFLSLKEWIQELQKNISVTKLHEVAIELISPIPNR